MHETVDSPTSGVPAAARDRTRTWSALCAGLFLPVVLVAGALAVSTERATHCVM